MIADLLRIIKDQINNIVILHGNIYDLISIEGQIFNGIKNLLIQPFGSFPQCLTYDLFDRLKIIRGDEKEISKAMGIVRQQSNDPMIDVLQQIVATNNSLFPQNPIALFSALDQLFAQCAIPTLFIVDHADALIPGNNLHQQEQALKIGIALTKWAQSEDIRKNKHCIILLCRSTLDLQPLLLDRIFEVAQIRFPKPDEETRKIYLSNQKNIVGTDVGMLNKLTTGLSLKDLKKVSSEKISLEQIFSLKKEILQDENDDLLEIMETRHDWNCIGGLEKFIAELKEIAQAIKSGDTTLVPMGIGFFGPPGTGKTILAEAFAKEAELNFIKPRDIKSMWVGESDKRMSYFINALKDMSPVVVFIDEFDQATIQRGDYSGDSGVSKSLFKKMLEIMSDTSQRGKILWIIASNRPDLIDPAVKRPGRCDMRLAFFTANTAQLAKICRAAFYQYPDMKTYIDDWQPYIETEKIKHCNGSEIVEIIRIAWIRARRNGHAQITDEDMRWAIDDFRPQILDAKEKARMTFSAFLECSSNSLLPDNWQEVIADCVETLTGQKPEKMNDDTIVIMKKQNLINPN